MEPRILRWAFALAACGQPAGISLFRQRALNCWTFSLKSMGFALSTVAETCAHPPALFSAVTSPVCLSSSANRPPLTPFSV